MAEALETLLLVSIIFWGLILCYAAWIHMRLNKLAEVLRKLEKKS